LYEDKTEYSSKTKIQNTNNRKIISRELQFKLFPGAEFMSKVLELQLRINHKEDQQWQCNHSEEGTKPNRSEVKQQSQITEEEQQRSLVMGIVNGKGGAKRRITKTKRREAKECCNEEPLLQSFSFFVFLHAKRKRGAVSFKKQPQAEFVNSVLNSQIWRSSANSSQVH